MISFGDIFSFKKQALKIFTKENLKAVLNNVKENILEQAKEAISGEEKKAIVDVKVAYFIREKLVQLRCTNKLVEWVVERIIDGIPSVTQIIYDCLKAKIEEL